MQETNVEGKLFDVAIIGSGVTGLSAALYSARYQLKTVVIGKILGGETSTAWTVENYPGISSIDGYDLVIKMKEQVEESGVTIRNDEVADIERNGAHYTLQVVGGAPIQAKAVIFAVGAARRKLGLPREEEFAQGKGIHYCMTCDGPLYKGKTVGVVGGGDAAVKGMNLAVQFAEKIYVFVRRDQLVAEPINIARLQPFIEQGKVEIIYNSEVAELLGDNKLNGVRLKTGKMIELDGLFIEIGAQPEVELAQTLGVELDEQGYIQVNNMMETNVPGIYAGGDATNFFGHFKQIVTGAAMGAVAATSAFKHATSHVMATYSSD